MPDLRGVIHLLDANVLIALTVRDHEHHDRAAGWLTKETAFAVCPMVQGALVRHLVRAGESWGRIGSLLREVAALPQYRFWSDDLDYAQVSWQGVRGHRQVTDVYLAHLARRHGGVLATMDEALAAQLPDSCLLLPKAR